MTPRMLLARLRGLFARRPESRGAPRIDDEIASHLDLLAAEYERRGMPPAEARIEARRQFGGVSQIAEAWRDQRSLPLIETFARDLRYALRQLRASPGFAAAAVLTLALGIGANTAIFRVLDAVVLRSLPVRDPECLVLVQGYHNGKPMTFSYPLLQEMARRQNVVEGTPCLQRDRRERHQPRRRRHQQDRVSRPSPSPLKRSAGSKFRALCVHPVGERLAQLISLV